MKRAWILLPIVLALAAAGVWWQLWLPAMWDFLRDQKDALGGLRSLVYVLGAISATAVAIRYFVWPKKKDPAADTEASRPAEAESRTGSGDASREPVAVRSTKVGERSVAPGGGIQGSVIVTGDDANVHVHGAPAPPAAVEEPDPAGSDPVDLEPTRRRYLDYLQDRYRYLDLKGMGVSDRMPLRLPLCDLYVPLQARLELPPGETWDRGAAMAGRRLAGGEAEHLDQRLSEPRPVLERVAEGDGLIVLGDPGSGKTTFLKFLAVKLAAGEELAPALDGRLPVLVPLSAFANALQERDALRLDDFVGEYVHGLGGDGPLHRVLAEALAAGRALLLLDGLDEVREPGLRQTVVGRVVDFFSFHRRAGNKFVMTSRVVGYRDVRTVAEGLGECTLVDFDDGEIAAFVERWTVAVERQASGETGVAEDDAERERGELLAAVERNPGVRRLAANPLLLTILALMKRQGVTLPERRVELYDQYVRTLLSTWNRARGLGSAPRRDLDVVETVRILAPLALWMHEVDPGLGLVKREDLVRRLETIFEKAGEAEPSSRARRFLKDVREHAGLLLERGPGAYGFIHLTFEEYLAAAAIALEGQGDARKIARRLKRHLDDPAWREVSLLLVGYLGLIQQLNAVAGQVLERLAADWRGTSGRGPVLAGEALLDVGATGATPESREKVIDGLLRTMLSGEVSGALRRRAGLALGRLGWRPEDLDLFVEVPAGPFLYGEEKEERTLTERFWIGKYPVTNLQYAAFVKDGGYRRRELWSEAGWAWREKVGRSGPRDYGEEWTNPIFPRVGVTLYEAEVYCRWLGTSARGFEVAGASESLSAGDVAVRLPTEEEWERAARGTSGWEYPWGDDFDAAHANSKEDAAGGTTAVCTYPSGESQVGARDMSGNVLEWTSTVRRHVQLCGGWFAYNREVLRCASRVRLAPDLFGDDVGFGCVLSLANSDS